MSYMYVDVLSFKNIYTFYTRPSNNTRSSNDINFINTYVLVLKNLSIMSIGILVADQKQTTIADPGIYKPGGAVPAQYNFLGLEMVLMPLHTNLMIL